MHPSLQWVKLWPWVMIVGMHIQEERRRGVEMLLSGSVFNGWKWLYEIVMVCCTPFALVSWRWRRRKREREIRNYWSTWIPWILLERGAMFMTIHFSLSLRNTFGSSKDRRLQADGSTSASNRFMHEDDTCIYVAFSFRCLSSNNGQLMTIDDLRDLGVPWLPLF